MNGPYKTQQQTLEEALRKSKASGFEIEAAREEIVKFHSRMIDPADMSPTKKMMRACIRKRYLH